MAVIKTHPVSTYDGYMLIAATKGRVWHLSSHDDEALCRAKVDRYLTLEEAAELTGICAKCSRILDRRGPYTPHSERTEAQKAPRRSGPRPSQGPASAPGWELLYDKPRQGYEIGRRYWGTKPEYALICKAHGYVLVLARLRSERIHRRAGNWCPHC